MLISGMQAWCFGVDIDSKSCHFGGRVPIIFDDKTSIPLRLEHALMTCLIRLPTDEELHTLEVHWLTANAPWDPLGLSEILDPTPPVPLGYSDTLGTVDLLDLDLEWETLSLSQAEKGTTHVQDVSMVDCQSINNQPNKQLGA